MRFDKEGRLWVGLEFSGLICQMDARELCRKPELPGSDGCLYRSIGYDDFKQKFGVNLQAFPRPIATHPHGFCFDEDNHTDGPTAHIWFTGKLTNTVGRLRLSDGAVEHFDALPSELCPSTWSWGATATSGEPAWTATRSSGSPRVKALSSPRCQSRVIRPVIEINCPAADQLLTTRDERALAL